MPEQTITKRQIIFIMLGTMLTLLIAALNNTIVGTAMPKIVRELQGMEHYSWPFTSYMLFSTIILPISGKLADIYGRKKITLLGIIILAVASMLCGISRTMIELSILRGFQGIGGGICVSSAFIIVSEIFPMGQRAKYIGLVTSMFALASIMGPVAGGIITDHFSWRWVFFVNIPLNVVAFLLLFKFLPVIIHHDEERKIDIIGVAAFVLTALPALFVVSQIAYRPFLSLDMIALTLFSLLMLILFLYVEKRSREPLLNLHYFKEDIFSASVIASALGSMAVFGTAIFFPLYLQSTRGLSATKSGLIMMPMMMAMILATNISGTLVSRFKIFKPVAVAGFIITCLGIFSFGFLGRYCSIAGLIVFSSLAGGGIGLTLPIFSVAPQSVFPHRQVGIVTSLLQFFRNLGGTVGSAMFGTIMFLHMSSKLKDVPNGNVPAATTDLVKNPAILTNPEKVAAIRESIPQSLIADFERFVSSCLSSVAGSIEMIFIVAGVILLIGLVSVILKFNEKKVRHAVSEYKKRQQVKFSS